jgi:hypothetical protein
MPPVPSGPSSPEYVQVIEAVRLELMEAGNPAFVVAILDAGGKTHASPVIFSAVGPSSDHARRVAPALAEGERVLLVSRQADRTRQTYNVLDPRTLRKLHVQQEVIEQSFLSTGGPI